LKYLSWQFYLGLLLVLLSLFFNFIHYFIFRDAHYIFSHMLGKLAFVPIEVLFVTLVIHRLLNSREKAAKLEKLNMVIGAFFSEVGTKILVYFSNFDPKIDKIREDLIMRSEWSDSEFAAVSGRLRNHDYEVTIGKVDLEDLRSFLLSRMDFLVRLLENPILLEHESFTDLLRAVFHLTEELSSREDLSWLPDSDYVHLAGDIKRAYVLLVSEWLDYMKHLKNNYPYLFSLAMRTNPFDQEASPIVK